jgi:multidrug resistance efflux pump
MQRYGTEKRRPLTKALGVLLAIVVAIASLALIAITNEPKHADSSPMPASAAIAPQIADAKSELEIPLRGKSFSVWKRNVVLPFTGEITKIFINEGQSVTQDEVLAEYKLDRRSVSHLYQVLYPESVQSLQKAVSEGKLRLNKLQSAILPLKKMDLERAEKTLMEIRELQQKNLASLDAVQLAENKVKAVKKEILEVEDNVKIAQAEIDEKSKALRFYESKQKRDVEFLEWQSQRSYSDESLPMDIAFVKAPVAGQVIWVGPEFRVKAEQPAGYHAFTVAPMNQLVVRCSVHELDIVRIKMGDRGSAVFDSFPDKRFNCTVSRISSVSRNPALEVPADYELECTLEKPESILKDGLTCNVKISVAQ